MEKRILYIEEAKHKAALIDYMMEPFIMISCLDINFDVSAVVPDE